MKFRKLPVEVEARQITAATVSDALDWIYAHGGKIDPLPVPDSGDLFYIFTLEGAMAVRPGDWLIRGVIGEFYPCKPDIFEQTYEPVE